MNNVFCPCGSGKPYTNCCEPFIKKTQKPDTAEQLMRSRFSAFCLKKYPYLVDTHHPSLREANELNHLEKSNNKTHWVKLTIHQTAQGDKKDRHGQVKFSAFFNDHDQFFVLHETSRFIQENGQWFYLDGNASIKNAEYQLKRNDPCWCGSGKKFKHCHLS
jgi:Uncharacterized protein conserved in bacteria